MNKNKKITTLILIGLISFTMIGCEKEANENNLDIEGNNQKIEEQIINTEDVPKEEIEEVKVEYTKEQILKDFEKVDDISAEIYAAGVNDVLIASITASKKDELDESKMYMKRVLNSSKEKVNEIAIQEIKDYANEIIETYQKEYELIKSFGYGEIDINDYEKSLETIYPNLGKTPEEIIKGHTELCEVLKENGVEISEILDKELGQRAKEIFIEEYQDNVAYFIVTNYSVG